MVLAGGVLVARVECRKCISLWQWARTRLTSARPSEVHWGLVTTYIAQSFMYILRNTD